MRDTDLFYGGVQKYEKREMNITKRLKSITAVFIAVVIMAVSSLPLLASAVEVQQGKVYGIDADSYLNVRSGAGTSYSVIARLYNDDEVTILGTSGNFYKISFENTYGVIVTGYASQDFIMIVETPEPEPEPEPNPEPDDNENTEGEGGNTEGDNTEGDSNEGGNTEGEGDNNEGGNTEGEGDNTEGEGNEGEGETEVVDFEEYLEKQGFPESYKVELRKLHEIHPEWVFTALHTNLDWNTVIKNESVVGKSLVSIQAPEAWRSVEKGAYNVSGQYYLGLDGSSWVAAHQTVVEYYMDPRNFLNESTILMFENLSYNPEVQTITGVQSILKNCFMKGDYTTPDTNETLSYAQTFIDAAKKSNVSPYHLATRALQEQGVNGSSLAKGTVAKFPGYFNFFNIQAYTSSSYTAVENGARYAMTTNSKYLLPWTNQYKSIVGGSIWIGTGYINKEQDTLYLQKFDVTDGGNGYYTHQYMTNIQAAESEAKIMKRAYPAEVFSSALEFKIPVYKNMPETACPKPSSTGNNNNLLNSLTVSGQTYSPDFNRYTNNYTLKVGKDVTSVSVSAVANNSKAKISGTGNITLNYGDNNVDVVVTATSGVKRTYRIKVTREKPAYTKGDVTDDGKVSINDVLTIVRHINGFVTLEDTKFLAGDVTGDGKISINDVLTIVRYINGFITEL